MDTNVIIANERAYWGLSRSRLPRALTFFEKNNFTVSLHKTEHPDHAKEIAADATQQGTDTIIVLGGDGTLNEVINGVLKSPPTQPPRIGIIPAGSSNDFSKTLRIPQRLPDACRTIINGNTRNVDIGQAGSQYFCVASSLGLFSQMAAESTRMKGLKGSIRYLAAAMKVAAQMDSGWHMDIEADEKTISGTYGNLLISNTPRFGGLTLAPTAKCDDGILDCMLIEMPLKRQIPQMAMLTLRSALTRHNKVTVFKAKSLSVSLDPPALLCTDGEVIPTPLATIDYRILSQKLQIICPQQSAERPS